MVVSKTGKKLDFRRWFGQTKGGFLSKSEEFSAVKEFEVIRTPMTMKTYSLTKGTMTMMERKKIATPMTTLMMTRMNRFSIICVITMMNIMK